MSTQTGAATTVKAVAQKTITERPVGWVSNPAAALFIVFIVKHLLGWDMTVEEAVGFIVVVSGVVAYFTKRFNVAGELVDNDPPSGNTGPDLRDDSGHVYLAISSSLIVVVGVVILIFGSPLWVGIALIAIGLITGLISGF